MYNPPSKQSRIEDRSLQKTSLSKSFKPKSRGSMSELGEGYRIEMIAVPCLVSGQPLRPTTWRERERGSGSSIFQDPDPRRRTWVVDMCWRVSVIWWDIFFSGVQQVEPQGRICSCYYYHHQFIIVLSVVGCHERLYGENKWNKS